MMASFSAGKRRRPYAVLPGAPFRLHGQDLGDFFRNQRFEGPFGVSRELGEKILFLVEAVPGKSNQFRYRVDILPLGTLRFEPRSSRGGFFSEGKQARSERVRMRLLRGILSAGPVPNSPHASFQSAPPTEGFPRGWPAARQGHEPWPFHILQRNASPG